MHACRSTLEDPTLLSLVQLDRLGDRHPAQLSGGQRQRVALARALAVEPKVLLLDEPFGSLDAAVRVELRRWLRRLQAEVRVTTVLVTHDQDEALEVADRVAVLNRGRLEQVGSPEDVFDRPATPFVMGFLGSANVFHGRVESGRAHLGPLSLDVPHDLRPEPATGYVRPHELEVRRRDEGDGGFWVTLDHAHAAGVTVKMDLLDESGRVLHAELTREDYRTLGAVAGDRLHVRPRNVRVFVGDGRAA